jgi:hypothetical protein
MDPQLQQLGLQLADAAVRNTAGAISDKIGASKARKRNEETIAELEEIISGLLSDKSELLRIAQAFEDELVAQRISPSDVEYISDNFIPRIEELVELMEEAGTDASSAQAAIGLLKPLLSVETVTILQLLGFNFRKAIGEPLTTLLASQISSRNATGAADAETQHLAARTQLAYLEIAQNPDAFARLKQLFPNA